MQNPLAVINQGKCMDAHGTSRAARLFLSLTLLGGLLLNGTALADGLAEPVSFMVQDPPQDLGIDLLPSTPTLKPSPAKLVENRTEAAPAQQNELSGPDATKRKSETASDPAVPVESMPRALTSPVLENVPTTLDKSQMQDSVGEAPDIPAATSQLEPSDATAEAKDTRQDGAPNIVPQGPRLRQRFSVLFTEQRPFLLYAQDTSISYLMPNALVEHPWISRILRGTLENRALSQWQELRAQQKANPGNTSGTDRPKRVISGRVEDRFSSSELSSLFLKETITESDAHKHVQLLSFNFDHRSQQAFGLRDLFGSQNDDALKATINLIAAYMRADIVRQKSIRLGTTISIEQDSWLKDLNPDLDLLNTFTLVPSKLSGKIAGLTFHFNPGLLGAEADGPYAVYIPTAIFAASLDASYADLFEGDAMLVSRHTATGFSTASVNLDGVRENAELGGDMLIEGEVPGSWCDGFHLTLVDNKTGQIVTEALIELLPSLPPYGLAGNMMRFRAELPVSGNGGQQGQLIFEPYAVATEGDRVVMRPQSACDVDSAMTVPDPTRDSIAIPVTY
ncbi:hypothetical protein FDK21_13985 [Cohaesibacter sp. CAU 1516]|uniref:RsiV family protein n=1 Tax=Cohaesibacter sp. CAU 1516 TaxID=2576038 RepID=UPI0010FF0343|nr:RsiV family protein [Cohaesibacter sp. CAU 1516]TLP44874.1 hypothetical protein FDK21_13985 [Cohaesibacter sp. CAU 1516]